MTTSFNWQLSDRQQDQQDTTRSASRRIRGVLLCLFSLFLGFGSTTSAATQTPDPELRDLLKITVNDASSFTDRFDAEVWLVDMSGRLSRWIKDPRDRLAMLRMIHQEALRAGLLPELVLSVIHVESRFDRFAISSAGAQGLMQVMPFWKKEIGRPDDNLAIAEVNLRYGCTILKHYLDKEKGNVTRALARYNGSLGKTWYPERVTSAWTRYWRVNDE